jgi:hypothetical protein
MNYSKLKWVVRGLTVVLAILGCCYVFDLILEGPSSIPIILISTIIAICVMVVVFELAIIIPMINWTQKQKISILRKREDDYEGDYAPETKPELPGGPIKRKSNSYNKSKTVRKPKTTRTNNKKKN